MCIRDRCKFVQKFKKRKMGIVDNDGNYVIIKTYLLTNEASIYGL